MLRSSVRLNSMLGFVGSLPYSLLCEKKLGTGLYVGAFSVYFVVGSRELE